MSFNFYLCSVLFLKKFRILGDTITCQVQGDCFAGLLETILLPAVCTFKTEQGAVDVTANISISTGSSGPCE